MEHEHVFETLPDGISVCFECEFRTRRHSRPVDIQHDMDTDLFTLKVGPEVVVVTPKELDDIRVIGEFCLQDRSRRMAEGENV